MNVRPLNDKGDLKKKIIKQIDENVNPSELIEKAIGYFFLQCTHYAVHDTKDTA